MPDSNITKKALADSMKRLMKSKDFDKISVIDICSGCSMNRKSFYYHFKDKYDLVNWIFYTDFITLVSNQNYESGWDLMRAVVDLFYQDQDFYRSALKIEGQNSFRDYFHESLTPIFHFFIQGLLGEGSQEHTTDYMCDAYLAVINRWMMDGCTPEPKKFIADLQHLIVSVAGKIAGKTV